jgi:hypothetical protein
MDDEFAMRSLLRLNLLILLTVVGLSGCSRIVSSATSSFAGALSAGILNQDDLQTVRDGAPAYLLLVDGFIAENPNNEALLIAGADLYGSYAGAFVADEARAQRLAGRAKVYGLRALCQRSELLCQAVAEPHEQFVVALENASLDDLPALYGFAASWATWIQLHSGDWNAIADLPKVEAAMERVVVLNPDFQGGWPHLYLGVLNTQLPPAYGGKPEQGRGHFEQAIKMSDNRNLMAKVLFARQYARLVFNQELHDRLLREALAAEPNEPGLTLINVLAKKQAAELLAESPDYF